MSQRNKMICFKCKLKANHGGKLYHKHKRHLFKIYDWVLCIQSDATDSAMYQRIVDFQEKSLMELE